MEGIFIAILVLGAILLAAVLFCVWAVVAVIRFFVNLCTPKRTKLVEMQGSVQICNNHQCACRNPSHARFCRRCGKSLPSLLRVVSSRVAVL